MFEFGRHANLAGLTLLDIHSQQNSTSYFLSFKFQEPVNTNVSTAHCHIGWVSNSKLNIPRPPLSKAVQLNWDCNVQMHLTADLDGVLNSQTCEDSTNIILVSSVIFKIAIKFSAATGCPFSHFHHDNSRFLSKELCTAYKMSVQKY